MEPPNNTQMNNERMGSISLGFMDEWEGVKFQQIARERKFENLHR